MKKIIGYLILYSDPLRPESLEKQVISMIKEGYQPYGPPVSHIPNYGTGKLIQAMVIYEGED